jgi:branched-subunit amino acid transport protein AzlD
MNSGYVLGALVAMMATTFLLRALPFVAAQWLQKHPFVQRLGAFLPLGIMTLLVLHSGSGAAADNPLGPWPEVAAVAVTAALQWRLKHPLLSILCGTTLYVAWRNGLF